MGSVLPQAPAGDLRLFEYELKMQLVSIKGRVWACSQMEVAGWFAKRFAGCGYPTITEVPHG